MSEDLLNAGALSDSMIKELQRLTPTPPEPIPAMRDCDMEVLPSYPPPPSYPTAPYAYPAHAYAQATVRSQRRSRRQTRSKLHWAVLAMTAAITAGLYFDPPARVNARSSFVSSTTHVIAMLPKHR